MRPGKSTSSTWNRSATIKGRVVHQRHATGADTDLLRRRRDCPIMISGAELAMLTRL